MRELEVGPVRFRVAPFDDCVDDVLRAARRGEPLHVHFANAYSVALADADREYASASATE